MNFLLFLGCSQQLVVREEIAFFRTAGIALFNPGRVGEHALDLVFHVLEGVVQEDAVVVALGHLSAVKAGAFGCRCQDGLRLGEVVAVQEVEAASDFPGQLHMGQLVLAYRDTCRAVHKNVGRHEDGVAEEAGTA